MAQIVKNPPVNAGDIRDVGLIPELGRSPRGGRGNLLQYFCLENPMDRGAWRATVHGVTKRRTRLKQLSTQHTRPPSPWRPLIYFLSQQCIEYIVSRSFMSDPVPSVSMELPLLDFPYKWNYI